MGQFTINPAKFQGKIASIANHLTGAATDLAACTDSPLDDTIVSFLPMAIQSLLSQLVVAPAMAASFESPEDTDNDDIVERSLTESAAAQGKILKPERLTFLVNLLKTILPLIPAILPFLSTAQSENGRDQTRLL